MIEPMNENNAIGAEIPNDIKIGKTITAIEITGPIPVIDIKIIAVTMQSKLIVIRGFIPTKFHYFSDQCSCYTTIHQHSTKESTKEYIY